MNDVDLGIWGKLTRAILVLLVAAAMVAIVTMYYPLLKQNERMRQVVYHLDTQIQQERALEKQFGYAIESMSKDPRSVERLAREKLGYAKPGETVIRFEEAGGVQTTPLR
ncbi:MAG: septum formation initiator family protein [Verrucomicrobiota bacterium]